MPLLNVSNSWTPVIKTTGSTLINVPSGEHISIRFSTVADEFSNESRILAGFSTILPGNMYFQLRTTTPSYTVDVFMDEFTREKNRHSTAILGSFVSTDDLPTTPTPQLGDTYIVGSDLWFYNGTEYVNGGNIRGIQGRPGETEFKTINGQSILGSGDISVSQPTSSNKMFDTYKIKPYVRPYPSIDRHQSHWSAWSNGSATTEGHGDRVKVRPLYCEGYDIVSLFMGIQGSITAGAIIEMGIYDSNSNGLPGQLLVKVQTPVVNTNSGAVDLATPILHNQHSDKVWLGFSLNIPSGGFQWQTTGVSHMASAEIGVDLGQPLNTGSPPGVLMTQAGAITGAAGTERTWPSTYPSEFFRNSGAFPLLAAGLRRPQV